MKRLFTHLLLLAALLSSTTAWGQSITVAGTSVNLSGSGTQTITNGNITGTVTYNASSKTLYLKDATIKGNIYFYNLGNSASERYFINVSGDNKIISSSHGIRTENSYVVLYNTSAGSSLTIDCSTASTGYACIDVERSSFQVWSTLLYMNGKGTGFYGTASSSTLHFIGSYVNVNCDGGAVEKFKSLTYDDALTTSSGTYKSGEGFVNSSGVLTTTFSVRPLLMIGKESVRTASDSRTGSLYSWKWTKSGNVLEVTGDIDAGTWNAIYNYGVKDLVIKTAGIYTVKSTNTCVNLWKDTSFEGAGTLKLSSTNYSAISTNYSAKLTLNMAALEAQGKTYGLNGQMSGSLILNKFNDNTVYKFAGADDANVFMGKLVMTGVDLSTDNSYWNPSDGKVYYNGSIDHAATIDNGTWFKSTNQISYYALWVGGTHVRQNSTNYISSSMITEGSASYDSSSKTLILSSLKMTAPTNDEAYGIDSQIDGLKIQLAGNNEINTNSDCFYAQAPMEFTGSGKLTATSSKGSGISVYGNNKVTLNANNELHFTGAKYGFWGHHNSTNTASDLILTKAGGNSDYYFTGAQASIYMASHIVCNDMDYYYSSSYGTPGCYYDESDHYAKQNGGSIVKDSPVNFYQVSKKYGFKVAGVEVTDCNKNAVGSPAINKPLGVIYTESSKTLNLNNVTIDYAPADNNTGVIQTEAGTELNINVIGDCTVKSDNAYSAFWLRKSTTTIAGDGTLNVSGRSCDIYPMSGGTLTINGDVTVNATKTGITSNNHPDALIIGGNAIVNAKEITGMNAINLQDGQTIIAPTGAEVNGGNVVVGGSTAKDVVIMKLVDYGLYFQTSGSTRIRVTNANAADIFGDGKASYNADTKTLTLNNADYVGSLNNIEVEGLKINVIGTCKTLYDGNANLIYLNAPTTITGTGTWNLTLTNSTSSCFYIVTPEAGTTKAELTFDGPTVNVTAGDSRCFSGWNADTKLSFLSGSFSYQGTGRPISNVQTVTLGEGMYITEPAGASLSVDNVVMVGGSYYSGSFTVGGATAYDLTIAGQTVTSVNCNDVLGDGKFKYDDASKTLTISGDFIYSDWFIESHVTDLVINVAGNTTLTQTSNSSIIRLYASTTITGGKLTLVSTASGKDALGIYISDGDLLIKDADIDIVGDGFTYGITGDGAGTTLNIVNSDITATAHQYGAIYDWGGVTLTGCYVEQPRPSQILPQGIAYANGVFVGEDSEGTVVIKKGVDAINGIDAAQTTVTDVYDVAGRKLDQTRRGINIVRTADGKTRKMVKK